MNIFWIAWSVAVYLSLFLGFILSLAFLFVPASDQGFRINLQPLETRYGLWIGAVMNVLFVLAAIMILICILETTGELGRQAISPFPWDAFKDRAQRHGLLDAIFVVLRLLIFHLWAFVIPGHCYAKAVARKTKRRPWYPYVINILVGLLLSTPHNPIYSLLDRWEPGPPDYP